MQQRAPLVQKKRQTERKTHSIRVRGTEENTETQVAF